MDLMLKYVSNISSKIIKLLKPSTPEEIVREFMEVFPGKCLICSYHRFGVENGLTSEVVQLHDCIDNYTYTQTDKGFRWFITS